jgi:hypothetical protein
MPLSRALPAYAGRASPLRPAPPSYGPAPPAVLTMAAAGRRSRTAPPVAAAAPHECRGEGPEVRPYNRGRRAKALSVARDPAARWEAVNDVVADALIANTVVSRAAELGIWRELMAAAGFDAHSFPTVEPLRMGAGSLCAAGFRSAMSYVDLTVMTAAEQGWRAPPDVARERQRSRRDCKLGLGPPQQAALCPVERIGEASLIEAPLVPDGPRWEQRAHGRLAVAHPRDRIW